MLLEYKVRVLNWYLIIMRGKTEFINIFINNHALKSIKKSV